MIVIFQKKKFSMLTVGNSSLISVFLIFNIERYFVKWYSLSKKEKRKIISWTKNVDFETPTTENINFHEI